MLKVILLFCVLSYTRASVLSCNFGKDFIFATATSAYQVEGAWDSDGKGGNVWDYITHNQSQMIVDGSTGDIACDSYNKYKEDVRMLKDLGVQAYRFSLSWTRLLPTGRAPNGTNSINPAGRNHYNNLINELITNGITPMVTLYHWDLPLTLQSNGGFQNATIVEDFKTFADLAFQMFGDRVKYWFTFNEPRVVCQLDGHFVRNKLNFEPGYWYRCNKNVLLAHAHVYRLYHAKYNIDMKGKMSMVIDSVWYEMKNVELDDYYAVDRILQFTTGIWAHPIYIGDYPEIVKKYVLEASQRENLTVSKLPKFTEEEVKLIKGTHDFYATNYYTTRLVNKRKTDSNNSTNIYEIEIQNDAEVELSINAKWEKAPAGDYIYIVPEGLNKLLKYINNNYGNPDILITENGIGDKGGIEDTTRIEYLNSHLKEVCKAKRDGVNIFGYTLWSLMDNFEWLDGYETKFGIYNVDYNDPNRKRTLKKSGEWYQELIRTRKIKY